ncbi:hypothetical protein P43SY_003064 [Pythium insidiosum]|uniref:Cilia- and flagella-associated protein 58 central coiled coil domain-containing protein n=1 Tax=Pythium insidiosum TaxID=114742 RepID=A0AAD5QAZ4_PYTIN|nr:hypothetical protein P43SY_003064 [Pythium insidiosum]
MVEGMDATVSLSLAGATSPNAATGAALTDAEAASMAAGASIISEMQAVMSHIPESIVLYRNELEKLLTACIKSQESEHRLVHRTKEILQEIQTSHEALLRDQEEENEAMMQKKKMRLELDALQQQIAASHQMEADKQQKLNDLRGTLALLQEELSKISMPGTGADIMLNEEQEMKIANMKKQRAETTHQLTEEMQAQWQKNVDLHKINVQMEQELHATEAQIQQAVRDATKTEKLIALAKEQLLDIEKKRSECENEKEKIKLELNELLNGAIEMEKKQNDLLQKKLDEMLREREVLNRMLVKANDRSQATFDLMKIKENTMKNLQNEISGLKSQVKRQRAQIQQLVGEREKYEKEATQATQKFMTSLEEAKLQDLQVASLQQKIVESESRLKQQQNLYEAVRTDRNLYSKQLIESQEEISEMKRKFKIMNHQIEQLKEEITSKDHALVKEHFDHHKVDKEKEILKNELLRIKKQIQSSEQIISNQELEITKLSKIIQEADEEKQRQLKEYSSVVHDRDALRQQLIQRNEELRVLYEKIKIQKSTLAKGHHQFQEKQKEIQSLQKRVQALSFEKEASSNQLQHEDSLKREMLKLEKELLEEKTKIRALSEELDHPLNVHRWRRLEGSDPKRFEMIRKLQALQKKLIKKYEETTIKDLLILEKEKLYVELKTILARQPGAEVAEQLAVYKETLKGKQNQMKQMEEELSMYKMQVKEYRREQELLEKERQQIRQEWLDQQLKAHSEGITPSNQTMHEVSGSPPELH